MLFYPASFGSLLIQTKVTANCIRGSALLAFFDRERLMESGIKKKKGRHWENWHCEIETDFEHFEIETAVIK